MNFKNVEQAELTLSDPTPQLIETLAKLDGDLMVLGVAGKMGPTLARMAKRAFDEAGLKRKVIGVARFSKASEQQKLESWGVQTIKADLLDTKALANLPDAPNIVYMAGMKFGSTGNEGMTWAMNAFLPGLVCQRYPKSRIAAFSTGNIYGLTPVAHGGPLEDAPMNPDGDYAQSCLGRERMFQHFSIANKTPVALLRVNYAVEVRYGVLVDVAQKVWKNETIDLSMGNFNCIWQADANAQCLMCLAHASSPPFIINIAGPEMMSLRSVANRYGQLMGREVKLQGTESPNALISNGQMAQRLFGYPRVSAEQMMHLISDWVMSGGESLNKPTHFETRDGKY